MKKRIYPINHLIYMNRVFCNIGTEIICLFI